MRVCKGVLNTPYHRDIRLCYIHIRKDMVQSDRWLEAQCAKCAQPLRLSYWYDFVYCEKQAKTCSRWIIDDSVDNIPQHWPADELKATLKERGLL